MDFPDKEEAFRFFTDVKSAILTHPDAFQDETIDLKFADHMLKKLYGEWKPIDNIEGLSGDLYEINREGDIRETKTFKVLEVFYDIDKNVHVVCLFSVDHKEWCVVGPRLAELMFEP